MWLIGKLKVLVIKNYHFRWYYGKIYNEIYVWLGSGVCVWSVNREATEKYNYPVETNRLPISEELKVILNDLIDKHDTALNWNSPQDKLLWDNEAIELFKTEAISAYRRLCLELGDDYYVDIWEDCLI